MKNLDLKECRDKLDVIDKEIVRLFEERMSVCGDVAEYKIGTGKPFMMRRERRRRSRQSRIWRTAILTERQ